MDDLLPSIVVIGLGVFVLYLAQRRLNRRREVPALVFAFIAHIAASFAQVAVTRGYYAGGDALGYHRVSGLLARLVLAEPRRFLPEVIALVFQGDANLPLEIHGAGTSTGTMYGLAALVALPTGGSIYAMSLVFSFVAFASCRALYQVYRDRFPAYLHQRLVLTTLALPSVVFWTSGIVKEAVAITGFAWMVFGAHRISQGRWAVGVLAFLPGLVTAALVKGYIVGAFVIAVAVFFYWARALGGEGRVRVRPVYVLLLAGLAVLGVLALGRVFPRYSLEGLVDETANLQAIGMRVTGGSTYSLGSRDTSLAAQLALSPLALATALFRPLPFEVSGATAVVNVVETTLLTAWLIATLVRHRWRQLLATITGSPLLMFSLTFIVLFGLGIGLATTNLGTLSRYRVPMMPLFASAIAILHARKTAAPDPAPAPVRAPVRGARRPIR